jgi:hypothetical protein
MKGGCNGNDCNYQALKGFTGNSILYICARRPLKWCAQRTLQTALIAAGKLVR